MTVVVVVAFDVLVAAFDVLVAAFDVAVRHWARRQLMMMPQSEIRGCRRTGAGLWQGYWFAAPQVVRRNSSPAAAPL